MQSLKSGDQGGVVISEKQEAVRSPPPVVRAQSRMEFGRGVRHYGEMDEESDSSEDMIILQRGSVGDDRYWSQLGKKV